MNRKFGYRIIIYIKRFFNYIQYLLNYLRSVLSEKQFLYLSSILVAISAGAAVIVLKSFAHNVFNFTTYITKYLTLPYITSLFPIIGILLTIFVVQKFLNGSIEKGTAQIMIAVAKKSSIMPKKQLYSQIVTSSLTVGMGGSAGLESPITITGAAFGSNYGKFYQFNYKDRTLLLACGVAAGISTAFNAPIAGVLFAIEVVLADMSITAFIPLMLSSATGALISNLVFKENVLLHFKNELGFNYENTFAYVLLGIIAGFVSIYHARMFRRVEKAISHKYKNPYVKGLYGASLLAALIFIFPSLFGEGYESIKILANDESNIFFANSLLESISSNQWLILSAILFILLIKSIATGLTLGSGGNGGNFAPSLFVGSYLGFIVAKILHLLGYTNISVQNFTVVGMAAVLSGLFHAPLTAIFLIAEITGGYGLIIPLMIVSSISFAISKRYDKYSMDIFTLADKGMVFTEDKDKNLLHKIDILSIYSKDIKVVQTGFSIESIKEIFLNSSQNFIPVLNNDESISGVITLDSFKKYLLAENSHPILKNDLISLANTLPLYSDALTIIQMQERSGEDYVLLTESNKYVGYVTKGKILEQYRDNLKHFRVE